MENHQRNTFREIHKNTWLKKLNIDGRKPLVLKKSERFWVVFCVHDDCEAFMEGYVDPRKAPSHNPEWSLPLKEIKHISHALVPVEQEYEFVVTLSSEIQRFNANTWECMQEWVDTLRSKLREMKLLSPKDNLYSKLPEVKPPLLPTRDPTSPLPAPPPVPAAIVPGIERVQPSLVASNLTLTDTLTTTTTTMVSTTTTMNISAMSNTSTQNLMNLLTNPLQAVSNSLDSISLASSSDTIVEEADDVIKLLTNLQKSQKLNQSTSIVTFSQPNTSKLSENDEDTTATCSSNESSPSVVFQSEQPIIIPRPQTSRSSSSADKTNDPKRHKKSLNNNDTTANITIIQVSNGDEANNSSNQHSLISVDHFTFNTLNNNDDYKSNVQIIPSNVEYDNEPSTTILASINENSITTVKVPINGEDSICNSVGIINEPQNSVEHSSIVNNIQIITPSSVTSENAITNLSTTSINIFNDQHQYYDHVFIAPTIQIVGETTKPQISENKEIVLLQQRSSSHSEIQTKNVRNNNKENNVNQPSTSTSSQTNSSFSNANVKKRIEKNLNIYTAQPQQRPIFQRNLTEMVLSRSCANEPHSNARGRRLNNQVTGKIQNEATNEHRKRSSSASDVQHPENSTNVNRTKTRLQSPPQPFRHHPLLTETTSSPTSSHSNARLTLREQQVLLLKREKKHPGGVRLQLRKKDCVNAIGFVDAIGSVWVAGWKQKDHPVLYTALHIGDQLVTICGNPVTSSADAQKSIRAAPGLFVELIIRRIPFGRVYAIKREIDGQCLGLIRDGNTSTIVDVVPNSLAARHGLPPKAQSCDGLSFTFWALTEINGRPLNLFFKDSEIKDRLNAVGRDISILVQPLDLVTKLKKQLKSLRSYKDFIVQ